MTARPDGHEEKALALLTDWLPTTLAKRIAAALRQAAAEERARIVAYLNARSSLAFEESERACVSGDKDLELTRMSFGVILKNEAVKIASLAHHATPAADTPYRSPDPTPRCNHHWQATDGRVVYCQFDREHTGPCWDYQSLPPAAALFSAFATPAAKTAEAGTCGECHLGVVEDARGTLSLCPACNGTGKARDGAGETTATRAVGEPQAGKR